MSVFVFPNSWRLSITFYRKTSELKKIPLTIFDFQYNFHSNSLRHHREITIVKFRIKLTFGKLLISRCASHLGTWLRGMKDTAESDSRVWCRLRSFLGTFFLRTPWSLTPLYETHHKAFEVEYLCEMETEFENTLACLSGTQMGSNHGKKWRSKISRHTPLNPFSMGCPCLKLSKNTNTGNEYIFLVNSVVRVD